MCKSFCMGKITQKKPVTDGRTEDNIFLLDKSCRSTCSPPESVGCCGLLFMLHTHCMVNMVSSHLEVCGLLKQASDKSSILCRVPCQLAEAWQATGKPLLTKKLAEKLRVFWSSNIPLELFASDPLCSYTLSVTFYAERNSYSYPGRLYNPGWGITFTFKELHLILRCRWIITAEQSEDQKRLDFFKLR